MSTSPRRLSSTGILLAAVVALAVSLLPACNRDGRPGKLDLPVDAGVPDPPVDGAARFVTALSTLRREPTEQSRVKSAGSKSLVANALATLHRGERVGLIESRDGWSRVRASDGGEGWLKSTVLAPVSEVREGTVLLEAWAFDRPDLLAANARRKLEPGTLLFIRKARDLFTEVDAGPGPSTWILTDRLTTQPADVEASKIVEKARFLLRNERPAEARELLALLRSRSPSSPLVPVLAIELGETPPDVAAPQGAAGAPGSAGTVPTPPSEPAMAPSRSP